MRVLSVYNVTECPVAVIFPLILFQVSTPVELPTVTLAPKQEMPKTSTFTPPSAALKVLSNDQKAPVAANPASVSDSQVSSSAAELPVDDVDEELDQLLSLQKPVLVVSGKPSVSVADEESAVPEKGEFIQRALFELCIIFLPNLKEQFNISGRALDVKIDNTLASVW